MTESARLARGHVLAALLLVALQALVLALIGRTPICTCGTVRLWHGVVMSAENSQHLADWYSFSHVTHGLLLYGALVLAAPRWPANARFVMAVGLEAAWEVFENTDRVVDRYRVNTVSLDYFGDSIVNSVADTLLAALGFVLAWRLPSWLGVGLVAVLELIAVIAIRDNLALNVVMLLWPFEAVYNWQAGR